MIASYVDEKHKAWDKYLPEFQFALNYAVHESTGVTPAELNLQRPPKGPLDTAFSLQLCNPDAPAYSIAKQIAELQKFVKGKLEKARQTQNCDKGRRSGHFSVPDRVWLRTHLYSNVEKSFSPNPSTTMERSLQSYQKGWTSKL